MTALFGRAVELQTITAHLRERALQRGIGVVILEGPPGSGKTRLLAEVRQQLHGAVPIVVNASPGGEMPPASVSLLAALERAATSRPSESPPRPPAGARTSWPVTLETANLLRARVVDPVILMDDVQWCDAHCGPLLEFLVRCALLEHEPMTIVLSGRSSPATAALTASLTSAVPDGVVVVEVAALDDAQAAALVAATNPGLSDPEVDAVVARASGLPFWCVLLARGGPEDSGVLRLVAGRLTSASEDAVALATTLAVLARPCHVNDLAEIHRWARSHVLGVLAELDLTGLLTWDSTAEVSVHHLLQEAVVDHVGDGRWRRAHRAVARWVEASADGDPALLLVACEHRCRAGVDSRDLVLAILNAPTRRRIGHEGLDVLLAMLERPELQMSDDLDVRAGLSRLAAELARHSVALDGWRYVAERTSDAQHRATAWLAACAEAQHLEDTGEASTCLERARAAAPQDDALLRLETDLTGASVDLWLAGRREAAHHLTSQALDELDKLRPRGGWSAAPARARRAKLRALVLSSLEAQQRSDIEVMLRVADEITEVAAGFDLEALIDSELRSGSTLMLAGRLRDARRRLRAAYVEASRAVLPGKRLDVGSWLLWTLSLMGELDEAAEVADECQGVVARLDERSRPAALVRLHAAELDMSRSADHDAFERLHELARQESDPHFRMGIRRAQALWSARLETADGVEIVEHLTEARKDAAAASCERCTAELVLVGVEPLCRVGAIDLARSWTHELPDQDPGGSMLHAWRSLRAQASLAVAEQQADAVELLTRAVELADEIGLRLELAWVRLDLARHLLPHDLAGAVKVLEPAHGWASSQGATTERLLIEQTLRRLGQRTWTRGPTAKGEGLASLSERELEVARHVSAGLRNPQIAERMFLSVKTIERHVSSALAKTNTRNRAELASLVASAGLAEPARPIPPD